MRIVIVTTYYSKGMGYTENCLSRALASLGHEVHVVTSNLNIYGNEPDYAQNYQSFLGAADQGCSEFVCDGYTVHRLASRTIAGYVQIKGLAAKIRELQPDVVHSVAIASLQTYVLAAIKPFLKFKLFTESHQHLSVVKPFLKSKGLYPVKRVVYWLSRTFPTFLASLAAERCYAVAPDCVYVANKYFGVPKSKLVMQSLGTDTLLFSPACSDSEKQARSKFRQSLGYADGDLICVYTGRFTAGKNPLLLAKAIDQLSKIDSKWHGLFVGEGLQREDILRCQNTRIVPFMTHSQLADIYRAADIAVWPRQESMSMLDAAASALPLIAADTMGESDRVRGSGLTYHENDLASLMTALSVLSDSDLRRKFGDAGREKMMGQYSWSLIANTFLRDYGHAGVRL